MRLVLYIVVVMTAIFSFRAYGAEWTIGNVFPAKTVVCDTEDQITSIIAAHEENGALAGRAAFMSRILQRNEEGDRVCGIVQGYFMIKRVVSTHTDLEGVNIPMNIVEVESPSGKTFYALWSGNIKLAGIAL